MIVKINGIVLADFTVNELTFNYDSVSDIFSLTMPFFEYWENSDKNKIKGCFKPLKYQSIQIFDDYKHLLLTGTILNHTFKSTASGSEMSLSGYSKTGILDDCPNIPKSENQTGEVNDNRALSTNFANLTLLEFAKKLVAPYNIEVIVDSIVTDKLNEAIEQKTTDSKESIASILSKLATAKNVVMRSTPKGELKFTQIDPTLKPVAKFNISDGVINDISISVQGQAMHSEIHIAGSVDLKEDEGEDKEKIGNTDIILNPLITSIVRPTLIKQGIETGMIKETSKAALADELKNITLTVNCKGWKMIDEGTLLPGQLISVKAPGVYLYNYQTFLVRSIQLKENNEGKSSVLNCVLPQTMTGDQPKLIFD